MKLDDEILSKVSGGSWDFNKLNSKELSEYYALEAAWFKAEKENDLDKMTDVKTQLEAFFSRMDAIYGL